MALACCLQISAAEEEVDRLIASKASAQAEADEADAAAQQALETGHAEVSPGWFGRWQEGAAWRWLVTPEQVEPAGWESAAKDQHNMTPTALPCCAGDEAAEAL